METENKTKEFVNNFLHKNKVHKILAHSYLFYFFSFLLGLLLDFIFPLEIFEKNIMALIGFVFLFFGTILIVWAQLSSKKLDKTNMSRETFLNGPYRYTRSPTHFGLFILMLGFGIMSNAPFIIIFAVISFFITKYIFLKKEEEILVIKYGAPYLEYKELVKF